MIKQYLSVIHISLLALSDTQANDVIFTKSPMYFNCAIDLVYFFHADFKRDSHITLILIFGLVLG